MSCRRYCLIGFLALCSLAAPRAALANLYDDNPYVVSFDEVPNFKSQVAGSDAVWMIHFFSPSASSSQQVVPEFSQVALIARGIFHVGAVDVSTDAGQAIAKAYGVKTSSSSIMFFGDDGDKPKKYAGKKTAQEMLQELIQVGIETIRVRAGGSSSGPQSGGGGSSSHGSSSSSSSSGGKSKVVQLTDSNFQQEVLDNPLVSAVAFTAPWCGHCKALVGDWEEAARRLDGEGAFLGWVDATAEQQLAGRYKVQGYPTIKMFPGGAKTYSDAMDYQGGRTAADIVQAVLAEVDRTGLPKPIPELVSEEVLKENCSGHNHICVLAALPHIMDSGADGRKAYQETFAKVAKSFRGSAFSFLWFEGTSQPDVEQILDMTFGFPAVAAFSMDKEAFVVMRTSFNEKNVAAFLHGVTSGRQRTAKVSSMPKVATTEPWNGMDAAPIEDEIPLCEVMGTCDEEGEL